MGTLNRITQQPEVMGGKACIRGMRVTVGMVVGQIGAGHTINEILADFPYLEREDILQALRYAAWRAENVRSCWPPHEAAGLSPLGRRAGRRRHRSRPLVHPGCGQCTRPTGSAGAQRQMPRVNRSPRLTRSMTREGSTCKRSTNRVRSMVRTCETFTTEGLGRPESDVARRIFPGASANARFDVMMATMTVAMRLSLKGLA